MMGKPNRSATRLSSQRLGHKLGVHPIEMLGLQATLDTSASDSPMNSKNDEIILTKKNFSAEPRRSNSVTDVHLKDIREAVLTATRISSFYHDYISNERDAGRKPMIMPRDAVQVMGQMRGQRVYICEQKIELESKIHAASMLWDEEIPVPSPTGYRVERFLEIGTQVSALPGFNLQWILTAVMIIEQLLYDPTGTMYAATYGDNSVAGPNFVENMHFVVWDDVPATVAALRQHYLAADNELDRGVKWFRPTLSTVVEAARLIANIHTNKTRRAKPLKEGAIDRVDEINLRFEGSSFRNFGDLIHAARDIEQRSPKTFGDLKSLLSRTLSESFIHLKPDELD